MVLYLEEVIILCVDSSCAHETVYCFLISLKEPFSSPPSHSFSRYRIYVSFVSLHFLFGYCQLNCSHKFVTLLISAITVCLRVSITHSVDVFFSLFTLKLFVDLLWKKNCKTFFTWCFCFSFSWRNDDVDDKPENADTDSHIKDTSPTIISMAKKCRMCFGS